MIKQKGSVEIAIIGAGLSGIATAYYLCTKYRCDSVLLIDSRNPMSYTSAQSGDNYRNWWPSEVMTQFTNHSIDLMQDIAYLSSNVLQMRQRGYAVATRSKNIDDLLDSLQVNYGASNGQIRLQNSSSGLRYIDSLNENWSRELDGVDVVSNKSLIRQAFPNFSPDIENVLHIRRAGDISGQQMGEFMLQCVKSLAGRVMRGHVLGISRAGQYQLEISTQEATVSLNADVVVNAAGPFIAEVGDMLGIEVPVENVFHQKVAFDDYLSAIPRNQPFSIDIDKTTLSWNEEDKLALAEDENLNWLSRPIDGGIHCRPEGAGRWVKLGWAYNRRTSTPDNAKELIEDRYFDQNFPEVVMRGASNLNPSLKPYIESLPTSRSHYGGYYTMTKENWPLIGPLDQSGAFIVGALSGFGSMGACAAGSVCADWIRNGKLPGYAHALSPARYQNTKLIEEIRDKNIGLL